jgi:general secretion pathway protein G
MNKTLRPRRPHEAGFTLIEIMVVLLIIGLIVSIVVPNLDYILGDANARTAKTNCLQLHETASLYAKLKNGNRPPEDLTVLTQKNEKGEALLTELPRDPWGNEYKIVIDTPTKWKVISFGPDGNENTEDDISSVTEEK